MFGFRLSTRITVATLTLVVIAGTAVMFAENARIHNAYISGRSADLGEALGTEKMRLNQSVKDLRDDALFLSRTPPVSGIMRAALNHGYDARDGNTRKKWETQLQQIFSAFISGHPEYYQIRYIGVADKGREIVRVENHGGKAKIAPLTELQQKSDRNYFKETIALHEGQVYLSEFDLRQEHGVIDLPYMPTLRASIPVFLPDGKTFGMVIINMEANKLFESATLGLPPGVRPYIANMQGQYLLHPDARGAFTFEIGEKGGLTAEFPFLKTMFSPQAADYLPMQAVATSVGSHYLAARRVHFDPDDPSRFLLLAYGIPGAVAAEQVSTIPVKHIAGGLIIMLLLGGFALLALRRTFTPLEHLTKAADKIAAGEQGIQLPQAGGGEIGSLTNALNTMLAGVAQREKEITQLNASLEERVAKRTEELSATNEELGITIEELSAIQNELSVTNEHLKDQILERELIEHQLQKAMIVADDANRAKGDFLATMSHEIRTPMNAIIGLSHLCMQTELTPKQIDYLQKVYGSAKALLGIINDVLDFSKIEAGKMDLEQVRFELEDVMGNLVTVITTKTEEKGLEFLLETSVDVPHHLIGDSLRLGQVLINLAGNAVKFTDKGEVLVLTEIEEETASDVVLRFTILDSGIGLTQEQIDKLFQAFTQADSTTFRKFGGTGLGLTISKRIVGLMGGKIWVESTPGAGSKFIFTARFQKAEERRAERRYVPNIDLRGMRVLAVDDNATSRHILQSYLESFTFNVTMASNGVEAWQAVEQADHEGMPYQFVVLDWKMPEMDGIEAATKIRAMAGLSKMPKILLISSFSQSEMLRHMEGDVVDDLLAKPFQQSELFDATMEIFGRAETRYKKNALTALFHPDLVAKISGANILLVEDNEINQQVAQELLEKAGVMVAIAENGEKAIARLWMEKFDGVLMDMQMPVMDGITATREIRKNPRLVELPIIAMTANVMAGDRDRCLAAGMNDHITKPLDPNQMLSILAKWVTPSQPTAPDLSMLQIAPSLGVLPNLPDVRVADGVRRMGDSVESYCGILKKFRNGQQNTLAEIRSAIVEEDWGKAERLAHTLRGLLGTLGAEKLQGKAAKLETSIRGRKNNQVESLLPAIELKLTQLFSAIERVLQSRATENGEDTEMVDMTSPAFLEELASLMHKAIAQLEEFDSKAEDTVARICRMVSGDDVMKKVMASIEQHVSSYKYEQGLAELAACAKSMGFLCEEQIETDRDEGQSSHLRSGVEALE